MSVTADPEPLAMIASRVLEPLATGQPPEEHMHPTAITDTKCQPRCRPPSPSQAHCTACHRTLRTVSDFDRHRRNGRCVNPAELGLIERDGLWASPEGHNQADAYRDRLATAREARRA